MEKGKETVREENEEEENVNEGEQEYCPEAAATVGEPQTEEGEEMDPSTEIEDMPDWFMPPTETDTTIPDWLTNLTEHWDQLIESLNVEAFENTLELGEEELDFYLAGDTISDMEANEE